MHAELSLEYTTQSLSQFSTDLQFVEVDAVCWKSEPVCRYELTDSIENRIVYDGHRLRFFFASDFDSIQSDDIKHVWYFQPIYMLFSFAMWLLATRHIFASVLWSEQL